MTRKTVRFSATISHYAHSVAPAAIGQTWMLRSSSQVLNDLYIAVVSQLTANQRNTLEKLLSFSPILIAFVSFLFVPVAQAVRGLLILVLSEDEYPIGTHFFHGYPQVAAVRFSTSHTVSCLFFPPCRPDTISHGFPLTLCSFSAPIQPPHQHSSLAFWQLLQAAGLAPSTADEQMDTEAAVQTPSWPMSNIGRKRALISPLVSQMQRIFEDAKASLQLDAAIASSPAGSIAS